MTKTAEQLELLGYTLRSGGASGADSAFQAGVSNSSNMEIYLPSRSFNGRSAGSPGLINYQTLETADQARATVDQYHPAPGRLSEFARHLMARNAMQVLGSDMESPCNLIVAYTPGGVVSGGTGQALRMAHALDIPVRNLGDSVVLNRVVTWLNRSN
jgi:hypothetical protein